MAEPSVGDHLRATETRDGRGTYRVVGVDDRGVTLLRVGGPDGDRVHSGETVRVERDALAGFEPAAPPADSGPRAAAAAYWSARAFAAELAARPLATGLGLALVAAGTAVSAPLGGGLIFAGSLLLAYVGSGRLRG